MSYLRLTPAYRISLGFSRHFCMDFLVRRLLTSIDWEFNAMHNNKVESFKVYIVNEE